MRKLFFVSATDVDGARWDRHVSAFHAEEAFTVWREDQNLSAEDAEGLYRDGVRVWLVLPSVPYSESFVLGWAEVGTF